MVASLQDLLCKHLTGDRGDTTKRAVHRDRIAPLGASVERLLAGLTKAAESTSGQIIGLT